MNIPQIKQAQRGLESVQIALAKEQMILSQQQIESTKKWTGSNILKVREMELTQKRMPVPPKDQARGNLRLAERPSILLKLISFR